VSLGFHRCEAGHCANLSKKLLSVYDMVVAGTSKQSVVALKAHLTREFDMRDLRAVNQMLWRAVHKYKQSKQENLDNSNKLYEKSFMPLQYAKLEAC
jgi:hypothetical protein